MIKAGSSAETPRWAIKCRSNNKLDGKKEYLLGRYDFRMPSVPNHVAGFHTMLFLTRQAARDHITRHYGYPRNRPDLKAEPFGREVPVPVKATFTVKEISDATKASSKNPS